MLIIVILILLIIVFMCTTPTHEDKIIIEPKPSRVKFSDDVIVRKYSKKTGAIIGNDTTVIINDKI